MTPTPETETFMQFLQGLPSKGWDEFALLVEEKVSQLERQRDAAIAALRSISNQRRWNGYKFVETEAAIEARAALDQARK